MVTVRNYRDRYRQGTSGYAQEQRLFRSTATQHPARNFTYYADSLVKGLPCSQVCPFCVVEKLHAPSVAGSTSRQGIVSGQDCDIKQGQEMDGERHAQLFFWTTEYFDVILSLFLTMS